MDDRTTIGLTVVFAIFFLTALLASCKADASEIDKTCRVDLSYYAKGYDRCLQLQQASKEKYLAMPLTTSQRQLVLYYAGTRNWMGEIHRIDYVLAVDVAKDIMRNN